MTKVQEHLEMKEKVRGKPQTRGLLEFRCYQSEAVSFCYFHYKSGVVDTAACGSSMKMTIEGSKHVKGI